MYLHITRDSCLTNTFQDTAGGEGSEDEDEDDFADDESFASVDDLDGMSSFALLVLVSVSASHHVVHSGRRNTS